MPSTLEKIEAIREENNRMANRRMLAAQLGVLDQADLCEWRDTKGYTYVAHYYFNGECKCGKKLG